MTSVKLTASFVLSLFLFVSFFVPVFAQEEMSTDSEYILGDVDFNGKVTAADARLTLRCSALLEKLDDKAILAADYNSDRRLTAADALSILRLSSGLIHDNVISVPTTTEPTTPSETTTEKPVQIPQPTSKIIRVNTLGQYPEFPSGCESVAAVMNLNYYGINITVDKFVDNYLSTGSAPIKNSSNVWYSSDPDESFLGNPRSDKGWGIWAKGLAKAINRCLDDSYGNYIVTVTYSETLDSLCKKYIVKDVPVLVWVTANMKDPYVNITANIFGTNKTFTWISPNHCMLLVGFDENYYYFNDPITGKQERYTKLASNIAFEANGMQTIVIEKQ